MISMYRQGLNPNISLGLAASRLYTMVYAIQIAYQMEEETKKKALMRPPVASNIRGERTIVDVNLESLLISLKVILIHQTRMFVLILLHHKGVVLIIEQSALIVEVLAYVFSMSFKTSCYARKG